MQMKLGRARQACAFIERDIAVMIIVQVISYDSRALMSRLVQVTATARQSRNRHRNSETRPSMRIVSRVRSVIADHSLPNSELAACRPLVTH